MKGRLSLPSTECAFDGEDLKPRRDKSVTQFRRPEDLYKRRLVRLCAISREKCPAEQPEFMSPRQGVLVDEQPFLRQHGARAAQGAGQVAAPDAGN